MSKTEQKDNIETKTFVVFPHIFDPKETTSKESRLEEAIGLALAINLEVISSRIYNIKKLSAGYFFSKGLLENIAEIIIENQIDLLIVDTNLSPIQQRNLEKHLKISVIDRTALILEIFGSRAKTREGVLQVELAKLSYQRSRLVRSWTHLSRQRGATSFIGGPGETQLELDRRKINEKIVSIKKDLEKVKKTRNLQRNSRKKVPYPIVALVGYTNVGKSTIFNKLTKSDVFVEDSLFATLDTTMRKVLLPSGIEIILSDTVGFISNLPHELVLSFRATLEEVLEADIILHVRDVSNPHFKEHKKDVLSVLKNLGLENIEHEDNYIEVLNKLDAIEEEEQVFYNNFTTETENMVTTSAYSGEGLDNLLNMIDKKISGTHIITTLDIDASDGKILSWIYENSEVIEKNLKENQIELKIKISGANLSRLNKIIQL